MAGIAAACLALRCLKDLGLDTKEILIATDNTLTLNYINGINKKTA